MKRYKSAEFCKFLQCQASLHKLFPARSLSLLRHSEVPASVLNSSFSTGASYLFRTADRFQPGITFADQPSIK